MKLWANRWEPIVIIVILLSIIGAINIFSASFVRAEQIYGDAWFFLKRHIIFMILGFILLAFVIRTHYGFLRNQKLIFIIIAITALLLLLVTFTNLGAVVNGSRRWLVIGNTQFQPSELAKLVTVIAAALYLAKQKAKQGRVSLLSWPLGVALVFAAIVFKQPDVSTAALIFVIPLFLYMLVGISARAWLALCTLGVVGVVKLAMGASYRMERITAWLDPWSDFRGAGYQGAQALIAIGASGIYGAGLGKGYSKFNYLPEAHTDFAFAVLCQEWGLLGALLVIFLFAALAWYSLRVAIKADRFGRLLCVGMTLLICFQAVANIAMVTGLLPVLGIPLPFISYGGTAMMVQFFAVGIIISVARVTERKMSKRRE